MNGESLALGCCALKMSCYKSLCEAAAAEFHCSKLCFCHKKRAFVFSPWLLPKWPHQVLYLLYRWVLMLYFLMWLSIIIYHALDSIRFKYFIFLTHWGFIIWNCYLVTSTVTVTIAALHRESTFTDTQNKIEKGIENDTQANITSQPAYCFRAKACSKLNIMHKVQWGLFLIGGEHALIITTLYWIFYTKSSPGHGHNLYSLDSLNLHMINGIFAVLDLWLSGVPVRVCHAVYSIGFGCAYILFTLVYYMAGGEDPEGHRYIYPFLDYGSDMKRAITLGLSCAVFFVGLVHILFFLQYTLRRYITMRRNPSYYSHKSSAAATTHC